MDLVAMGIMSAGAWDKCVVCEHKSNTFLNTGECICTMKCLKNFRPEMYKENTDGKESKD